MPPLWGTVRVRAWAATGMGKRAVPGRQWAPKGSKISHESKGGTRDVGRAQQKAEW